MPSNQPTSPTVTWIQQQHDAKQWCCSNKQLRCKVKQQCVSAIRYSPTNILDCLWKCQGRRICISNSPKIFSYTNSFRIALDMVAIFCCIFCNPDLLSTRFVMSPQLIRARKIPKLPLFSQLFSLRNFSFLMKYILDNFTFCFLQMKFYLIVSMLFPRNGLCRTIRISVKY